MKVIDDGIIKYDRTNFSLSPPLDKSEYSSLEYWRKKLYNKNLIGEYPNAKIGFGNISQIFDYSSILKTNKPQFVISGTQTGKYPELDGSQYTRILDFNIDMLKVTMQGQIEASSEVLTHAAIYERNILIQAVFHIHSQDLWRMMIEKNLLFTSENIPYGTIEMAHATQECIGSNSFGVFCMRGHIDGIVGFGRSPEEAWNQIMKLHEHMT
jgi:ribulose-5-phosphate 4-epimerase/fuculose-1-phosphate aldolase